MIAFALAGELLGGAAALAGAGPKWVWKNEAGIEWVQAFDEAPSRALVVCTRDSRIEILDVADGRSLLDAAIPVGAGARLVTTSSCDEPAASHADNEQVLYLYDRSAVYAIAIAPRASQTAPSTGPGKRRASLKWRIGDPLKPADVAGDPEFISQILAVSRTSAGVLIVGRDGRVTLLSGDDGRTLWALKLSRMSKCRLHVRASRAAIVADADGRATLTFLSIGAAEPTLATEPVGGGWPHWSRLADEGAVLVWPERIALFDGSGSVHSFDPPKSARLLVGAAEWYSPPTTTTQPAASGGSRLLIPDMDEGLHAFDVAKRAWVWSIEGHRRGTDLWTTISCHGDAIVVERGRLADVLNPENGKRLGGLALGTCSTTPISGSLRRSVAELQWIETEFDNTEDAQLNLRTAPVFRVEALGDGALSPIIPDAFQMRPVERPRGVLWCDRRLVVVGDKSLQAFLLP